MIQNEEINLKKYYDHLRNSPNDLIEKLAEKCKRSFRTVQNWIYGKTEPSETEKNIIQEFLKEHQEQQKQFLTKS